MIPEYIDQHLGDLLALCSKNTKNILVYRGFPLKFIRDVAKIFPFVAADGDHFTDNKIDLKKIAGSSRVLVKKILDDGLPELSVMLYEEYSLLSQAMDLDLLGVRFIVVMNELYSAYPNETAEMFCDFEEKIAENDFTALENQDLASFYVYSARIGSIEVLQYRDAVDDSKSSVVKAPFFDRFIAEHLIAPTELEGAASKAGKPEPLYYGSKEYDRLKYRLYLGEFGESQQIDLILDPASEGEQNTIRELKCLKDLVSRMGASVRFFAKGGMDRFTCRNELTEILKTYWKSPAFRQLRFYEKPSISARKVEISQGEIIENVVSQVEAASSGKDHRDIFLTAPTGSGKSLLFQIPSIYIAQKYGLVTIIISPLISLMFDQVNALKRKGVAFSACINSNISFLERKNILEKVKSGEISILYLSPELLLSYDIREFIGNRRLGLLVIDEAHLVTTWGRDFRVDYWFIGTYISRLKRYYGSNYRFPVFALTATAVYGGSNDTVFETIGSLHMNNPIRYIGNIKREDVQFDIRDFKPEGSHENAKIDMTISRIKAGLENGTKSIVYFPYRAHIERVRNKLCPQGNNYREKIGRYYSDIDPVEKQITMDKFKEGEILTVLATKAFGMGVDIDDISCIYHHAPSGGLADYVQEIGRVARKPSLEGIARTDFCVKDLKFSKVLYGLSSVKEYQVRLVLQKLWNLYSIRKRQNMLISSEDFWHVFIDSDEDQKESKVKSALMMLERDLEKKYGYKVIIARPKSLFAEVYACIHDEVKDEFMKKYGGFANRLRGKDENIRRIENGISVDPGDIYGIRLDLLWERFFDGESFPMIKRKSFTGELFVGSLQGKVHARYKLEITLAKPLRETILQVERYFGALNAIISGFGDGFFSKRDLYEKVKSTLGNEALARKITDLILNLYVEYDSDSRRGNRPSCFIQSRGREDGNDLYRVISTGFIRVREDTLKQMLQMFRGIDTKYFSFLPYNSRKLDDAMRAAYVLEAFNLGSYESLGGQHPKIFIRINDPYRLSENAEREDYKNALALDIKRRHESSVRIMEKFFLSKMTNKERWEFIENYFLGNDVLTEEVEKNEQTLSV